ncbi:hypothetical protein ASG90_20510 [Nocardioides sp. Soil797]|nr:hypothetical protein ASG90_20510 [Nocardioides sp. Soil797]
MERPLPTAQDVADFLRWDEATTIEPHLASVTLFVRAYTRGVGFSVADGNPYCLEDIAAVIVQATARSAPNPAQVTREEIGSWNAMPAKFDGFTIAEQFVLNEYRRRTA